MRGISSFDHNIDTGLFYRHIVEQALVHDLDTTREAMSRLARVL